MNDLVAELKATNVGVDIGGERVCILLYADDMVLIANDARELQLLLDRLGAWCDKWAMMINAEKTQIVHFRPGPATPRSTVVFTCGDSALQTVEKYRYLNWDWFSRSFWTTQ